MSMMISKTFIVICCLIIGYGCGLVAGFSKGGIRYAVFLKAQSQPISSSDEVRSVNSESTPATEPIRPQKRMPKPLEKPLDVEPWDDPKIKEILKAQGIDVSSLLNLQKEALRSKESKYSNTKSSRIVSSPKKSGLPDVSIVDNAHVSGNPGDYLNFADFLTANTAPIKSIAGRVKPIPITKMSSVDSLDEEADAKEQREQPSKQRIPQKNATIASVLPTIKMVPRKKAASKSSSSDSDAAVSKKVAKKSPSAAKKPGNQNTEDA